MISVAVKNMNLFIAVKTQFEEFNTRLCRLDIYLSIDNPTEAVKSMLARVMTDILLFCGLATKYFRSKDSIRSVLTNGRKYLFAIIQTQKSHGSYYTRSRQGYYE
jgi:hypothetical protein